MTTLRPLSPHCISELREIAEAPIPRCAVNPGVVSRLSREGLIVEVSLRSPFAVHKGGNTSHLQITDAGKARLKELGEI